MVACASLAGCGATAKVAATTTTVLAPITLPISLATVESFFDAQGGGDWKRSDVLGLANFDGMAQHNDTCPTSIGAPKSLAAVSAIDIHCASGGPPNTTLQQAVALYVATVQRFVPAGVSWTKRSLAANISGSYKNTFGNAVIELGIATPEQTLDLGIFAKGFTM